MEFNYAAYRSFLSLLLEQGYAIANYHNYPKKSRCVILRHDIDQSIEKAVIMGEIEAREGISSTYFVLLTSDIYNASSAQSKKMLQTLRKQGHEIGLHFDEKSYSKSVDILSAILNEVDILEKICGTSIRTVSMHRPSQETLNSNLQIPGMVNCYEQTFFQHFKYLSDSRRHWKEPVLDIIKSHQFERLHILTHPFWYEESTSSISATITRFVNHANKERYCAMQNNIRELSTIMTESDVL